jgi:hypothetical protein
MRSRGGFGEVSGFEQGWGRISILEAVMNSIRNGLGMRGTEIVK